MQYQVGTAVGRRCTERTVRRASLARWRWRLVAAIAPCVVLGSACGGGDESAARARTESTAAAHVTNTSSHAGVSSAAAGGAKPICPATGQWQLCSVVERLDRAGLAPQQDSGRVTEAPLSSPGASITLGRAELRVFVYADRSARERDQAKLDTSKYVSANEPLSMQVEPTLIASENLLAILRSRSDHQRERVSDALTAGPPQKPRAKG